MMIVSSSSVLTFTATALALLNSSVSGFSVLPKNSGLPRLPLWLGSTTPDSSTTATAETTAEVVPFFLDDAPEPPCVQRSYRRFDWQHNGQTYQINYRVEEAIDCEAGGAESKDTASANDKQPVLLVHGFGANVNHFRHQFPALTQEGYRVYAIDLIGFGGSDKATDVDYSIEVFVQLLQDFLLTMNERYHSATSDTVQWMVAGNSIGGLCSLGLAKALPQHVQGVVLFNCAGGMSGFRYEDVPIYARPILYLVQNVVLKGDWGRQFFADFKTPDNVESILRQQGVYCDQTNVNDELMDILLGPSDDDGAETVFLKVFGGPPGPTPESLLPDVPCPILALWGQADPWTPYDKGAHPATEMAKGHHDFELTVLPETGHCPHDERPELCHSYMIPWMKQVKERYTCPAAASTGAASAAGVSKDE